MTPTEPDADLFNRIIDHPLSHAVLDLAAGAGAPFDARRFVAHLAIDGTFPAVSVRRLIEAVEAGGIPLDAYNATTTEASAIERPFLCYLRRSDEPAATIDLHRIISVNGRSAVMSSNRAERRSMPRRRLDACWSGIVLSIRDLPQGVGFPSTLSDYRRDVAIIPGVLDVEEREALVAYCEAACFKRSRVLRPGAKGGEAVDQRVRSSSSVVLFDRQHPVLQRLYQWCAAREGVSVDDIEHIQCVRYKRGQKFRPHFDGGLKLPRIATYLIYLNDDFDGGETYFPRLNLSIAPQAGACLRFPSCDGAGRILWPSQHGGLPVGNGVKYALNIWVRRPGTYGSLRGSASATRARLPIAVTG